MFSSKKHTAQLSNKNSLIKIIYRWVWVEMQFKKINFRTGKNKNKSKRLFPPIGTFGKRTFILEDFESICYDQTYEH